MSNCVDPLQLELKEPQCAKHIDNHKAQGNIDTTSKAMQCKIQQAEQAKRVKQAKQNQLKAKQTKQSNQAKQAKQAKAKQIVEQTKHAKATNSNSSQSSAKKNEQTKAKLLGRKEREQYKQRKCQSKAKQS